MSDKDGGQAFPVSLFPGPMGDLHAGEPGMTLRDWFAGQAAASIIGEIIAGGNFSTSKEDASVVAKSAYLLSDAMLAERTKS